MTSSLAGLDTYYGFRFSGADDLERVLKSHFQEFYGDERRCQWLVLAIIARDKKDRFWEKFLNALAERGENGAAEALKLFYPEVSLRTWQFQVLVSHLKIAVFRHLG